MNRILVPYTLAKKAKEKKFNERCLTFYMKDKRASNNDDWAFGIKNSELTRDFQDCTAPTHQQLIDWFRIKHKIDITQVPSIKLDKGFYQFQITRDKPHNEGFESGKNYYKTLNRAIKNAFNLIEKK